MNSKLLAALFGVIVISASAGVLAKESAEYQDPITERLSTVSPEDMERMNERFKSVEAASQAQAEKASEGAEKANPVCEVVLCMFGKLSGASQSECKSSEKKYFKILVKKKGKPNFGKTASERLKFLDGCPSPMNKKINDKFGKILG